MKLTILLFFTAFTLFGQNIEGVVLDQDSNKPLENVNVYFNTSKKWAVTNKKGEYYLKSSAYKGDSIQFSIIGYASKKYVISELIKTKNIVYLSKKTENLDEVLVRSNKGLKPKIHFKKLATHS